MKTCDARLCPGVFTSGAVKTPGRHPAPDSRSADTDCGVRSPGTILDVPSAGSGGVAPRWQGVWAVQWITAEGVCSIESGRSALMDRLWLPPVDQDFSWLILPVLRPVYQPSGIPASRCCVVHSPVRGVDQALAPAHVPKSSRQATFP
jgi:hypothetical protein